MLDCDIIISNPTTLTYLMSKDVTVIAPMLNTESTYSNFWAAMTDNYYYAPNDNYASIYNRKTVGTFVVPMIHSSILINLKKQQSDYLSYKYVVPMVANHFVR